MRCHICDRLLSEPKFNKDTETWEPCDTCMEVIHDTLAGYHDRTAVEDDELGDDPPESLGYPDWMRGEGEGENFL